jgi:hypothetical protein
MPHASNSFLLRTRKGRHQRPPLRRSAFVPTKRPMLQPANGLGWWVSLLAQLLDDLTGISEFLDWVGWSSMLLRQAESVLCRASRELPAKANACAPGRSRSPALADAPVAVELAWQWGTGGKNCSVRASTRSLVGVGGRARLFAKRLFD